MCQKYRWQCGWSVPKVTATQVSGKVLAVMLRVVQVYLTTFTLKVGDAM